MKKQTRKLLSTVLSATTLMSTLTLMPSNVAGVSAYEESEDKLFSTVEDENGISFVGVTGDRTLEEELPEDVTFIETINDYYELSDTKGKLLSDSSAASALPESVDNSQSEYFPEIGSQGSIGSCVAWAQSYYQFTYTMNKNRGVATTTENTFSPKFTYNIANGGRDVGSFSSDVYDIMKKQGNVPITLVPYDNDYLSWSPVKEIWRESIRYRIKDYQYFEEVGTKDTQITSPDDDDLTVIKTALSNGDVLTYSTYISDWKSINLKTNFAAPENSKYEGETAIKNQAGYTGSHRMTLVGYNDNIWVDVNENNTVDDGEMGAFKIANSWGDNYANDGFAWVAYDALNIETSVSGGPETRARIFSNICRIDVMPYNTGADIYMTYTLNSANRRYTNATVTAEKDGTKYSSNVFTGITGWEDATLSYDGTSNPNDGTMVFALNNIVPELTSENFSDYVWNVEFKDQKADDIVLTVKDAEIVDETINKLYKPENVFPFELEDNNKTLTMSDTTSNNVVIYYRGLYNPNVHYKVGNEAWKTEKMPENIERRGFTHKYVIELEQESDVKLYFSDDNGNVDDNNGQYFTAGKGLNYFVTENVADPIKVKITKNEENLLATNKLVDFTAEATGGYEPYLYQFEFENLDTGEKTTKQYLDNPQSGNLFKTAGNYRITVNVKDYSDNIESASIDIYLEDKAFEYTSFTVNPDKQVMIGDNIEFTASTNFEQITYIGYPKNTHQFTIQNSDGEVVYTKTERATEYSLNYKTSTIVFPWVPTKADSYTAVVSSTDGKSQYAEKTIKFDVTEYNGTIVGDADNNKEISITDALAIMRYTIGGIDSSKIWLALSDCNKDSSVDLKDAIYILRYVVLSGDCGYVGEVNYRETPTEPPTEAPTEAPTNPVEENMVTFSNAHSWSGTIYCYYWSDTNKSMTTWPGKPMTYLRTNSYGQDQYTFTVPDDATYIIFSNGSTQTVDISYGGGEINYYPTTTDSKGHYNVETW